jgi:putative nucleotidyltransferase with HDIG domain
MSQTTIRVPKKLSRAIEDMPAISPIVGKIQEMAGEIDTSPRDLVKVIMLDPVLTGKVIRLVNSSFYGLPNKVKSLAQAVVLLGLNTVKNLAISTAVLSTMFLKEKQSPIDPSLFWKHCLATAVGAKMIAGEIGIPKADREMFFVAGLLHDLGKVLYIRTNPDLFARALRESREAEVILSFSESALFGLTHQEIGTVLARKWKLDPKVVNVISNHHPESLEGINDPILSAVIVANTLTKRIGLGESGNICEEEIADQVAASLDLDADVLDKMEDRLPSEVSKAEIFLNIAKEDA